MRRVRISPRPGVRTLAELVAEASAYADAALRATGSVRPTMLALTPRGVLAHDPDQLANEDDKDRFATECRLLLVATGATASVMVLESWMVGCVGGGIPDTPPSESPRRIEVVTISGEARTERRFLMLPIRRTTLGLYAGLGEDTAPPGLDAQGRFSGMIGRKKPRRRDADAARAALSALGVTIAGTEDPFSRN
jgi:hypothetical protein